MLYIDENLRSSVAGPPISGQGPGLLSCAGNRGVPRFFQPTTTLEHPDQADAVVLNNVRDY